MPTMSETSDQGVLELLRQSGPQTISEIAKATGVTANAVRQRLTRLMNQQLVQREAERAVGRGRPNHRYSVTEKARRTAGTNFADLAVALWRELKRIENPEIRRGLLQRIAESLTSSYADRVQGESLDERLAALVELFGERGVPLSVEPATAGSLPVLTVHECPYPDLAQEDRGICAVEKLMFASLLDENLRLTQCRLDDRRRLDGRLDDRRRPDPRRDSAESRASEGRRRASSDVAANYGGAVAVCCGGAEGLPSNCCQFEIAPAALAEWKSPAATG